MFRTNQSTVTEFLLVGLSVDPFVQMLLFPIFLVVYMATLTGNLLLMLAVRTNKCLHTSMYFFLASLAFLDICYTSSIVPNTLVNFLLLRKSISFTGCAVQFFFALFFGGTECFLLAFMAYDRYVAICNPLHYNMLMNIRTTSWMIGISWLTCSIISSLDTCVTFRLTFCGPNIINHFFCELPQLLQLACSDLLEIHTLNLLGTVLFLFIPLFFILMTYLRIIATVMSLRLGKTKAFSTCISHLVVVCIFYGTAVFMYVRPDHLVTKDIDKRVAVFYTVITPMLNPLIYSLRNKDVKRAMRRLVGVRNGD